MQTHTVKVAKKTHEADGIVSFELIHPSQGQKLPAFSAGAHIDVVLKSGKIRQYSLCNPPQESARYLIGVLRDPASRGGSNEMHDDIHEGDLLQVSAPRNLFPLLPARRSILFAGGIGITPILSMAAHLFENGDHFELHYCTRSREKTAFQQRIATSGFAGCVHFHFSTDIATQQLNLAHVLAQADPESRIYVCGPAGFITAVKDAAQEHGWPQAQIHSEYFIRDKSVDNENAEHAFDVKIASTGQVILIPTGQPVTVALAQQGIVIPVSCEQGICGTCVTGILQGEPDHRDFFLTDAEKAANKQFTPCCSRANTALLVLDL